MIMLCWFYCIPFAKLFYFALGPLLFLFSLFALKRGIRQARKGLRQGAFLTMFFSCAKVLVFDVRLSEMYLVCESKLLTLLDCTKAGFRLLEAGSLVLLLILSFVLLHFYRIYIPDRKPKIYLPHQVHLRFWANIGLLSVVAMIVWTMAPWVGALTVGFVPKMFSVVQWQHFAILNVLLLLIGLWKVESCSWEYNSKDKSNRKQVSGSWTPRDTLWLNFFLYLITLALSYIAHDILTGVYQGAR